MAANGGDQFRPLFAWHVELGAEGSLSDLLADAHRLDESIAEVVAGVVSTGFGFANEHDAQDENIPLEVKCYIIMAIL